MPQNYVPIFLFLAVVGILIPVTLLVARIIRTQSPNRVKLMPYECGIDPYDSARGRYTVRYYIVAILFESTGGTDPITSHGHRKADAVRIRDLIERFQAVRR